MIRATDATLLDEWELLSRRCRRPNAEPAAPVVGPAGPPPAWRTAVRTAAFGWVELLAGRSHDDAGRPAAGGLPSRIDAGRWAPYWAEFDVDRRSTPTPGRRRTSTCATEPGRWVITQRLVDPEGNGDWRFVAAVDLAAARWRTGRHRQRSTNSDRSRPARDEQAA